MLEPGVAVSVSVDHPFPLGQVGVASPVVLGLEMLHLGEDVVTIAHLRECSFNLKILSFIFLFSF